MFNPICIWPYSALASVHYDHTGTALQIWIIFKYPMDTSVKPPLAKWIIKVNAVVKVALASSWLDEWTLSFAVINIPAYPDTVTVAYDGPDEGLRTSWYKQWEPFGTITAIAMPYNWQNVLDIDVPNAKLTVNGTLLLSHKIIPAGTYDDFDVEGSNILYINTTAGDVIINGFSNGVFNQIVFITKVTSGPNDATLKHSHADGTQKLLLHAMADETLTGEYGGWTLVCHGTFWTDISHSKHV